FPDSKDYKTQSEFSIFSFDFFAPKPTSSFSPRPFTVPLFYKLASSDPCRMVMLQKVIHCISVITLVVSILMYLSKKWIKLLSLCLLLYFFTWWNIVGWTGNILSESLSLSFMLLWFAIILCYYRKQSWINFLLLTIVTILLSFTRDTWPYIILLYSIINILILKLFNKNVLKQGVAFFVFSICLFLAQNYSSSRGERYKLPVFNSIAGRIAQNDSYLLWFENEGMPLIEKLKKDFRGILIDEKENRSIVYSKYNDPEYVLLNNWILKDGKKVYQKFILTHWSYFLLFDQTFDQSNRIFCSNLQDYTQKPKDFFLNADSTFPYFSLLPCILLIVLIALLMLVKRNMIFIFPVLVAILFTVNALISYNADALEVKRHLFVTQIVLEFISLLSLLLLLDNMHLIKDLFNKIKKVNAV
ncbi:MAG: hypothetical protein V4677_00435, partial [Bacteroidota bacterium]